MNKSPLTTVLTAVLALSALASVWFCYSGIRNSQELRGLQFQINNVVATRNIVAAVANDTLEYSKTHPAINPILENV